MDRHRHGYCVRSACDLAASGSLPGGSPVTHLSICVSAQKTMLSSYHPRPEHQIPQKIHSSENVKKDAYKNKI